MSDLVALHPNDDDETRARNILAVGGFAINETVERMLPRLANAIRLYRDLDAAEAAKTRDDAALRSSQFTAPWPSR